MKALYTRPKSLLPQANRFCPGCGHSTVTKLIGEVLDELGIADRTINVVAIGCCGLHAEVVDADIYPALHGRAPAVATGIKRVRPDTIVYAYQGDGDLASIGLCETIHTANRGENFTTIFVNNAIYGMTGGQMAPTTLEGQKATTAPNGRDAATMGYPLRMCELINQLRSPVYIARAAVDGAADIRQAKSCIKKAFELQMQGKGYSFVEILSGCPTGLGSTPQKANQFVAEQMKAYFPLGVFRAPKED